MAFAGWVNRFQQDATEYLKQENRVLGDNWADADYVLPMLSGGGSWRRQRRWVGMPLKEIADLDTDSRVIEVILEG